MTGGDPCLKMSQETGLRQGIPINMTGIASLLKRGGYRTHMVGKWDVGMATAAHHPRARGYESWFGYWHHTNDYWQHTEACLIFILLGSSLLFSFFGVCVSLIITQLLTRRRYMQT